MDNRTVALQKHSEWKGKLDIALRAPIENDEDLAIAYTPGVAEPCLEIRKDEDLAYEYTGKGNLVAVITDGTAVLGLGDIGPSAAMPVMEGKCALFKAFGDVDAFPLCIKSNDVDEIVNTIYLISDEPYREIVFSGVDNPFVSDYYADTIICYSFSKSLSLPGERIGYVAVNPACSTAELIIDMCAQISRCIGHNCPSSLIQYVAGRMCGETSDLTVYETNARMLYKELTAMGYTCQEPGGTFYMFPKALEEDAMAFCQKALEYNLVLVPGDSFGCPGYFRISYCVQTEKAERSVEAFKKLAKAYGL